MSLSRDIRRWSVLLLLAACGDDGAAGACPAGTQACGNGCIPDEAVCCGAVSSSYCTNGAGGGCFPNDGRCSAAFPSGVQAEYCCSENGSFGSNDCSAGQHHCGLLCYPVDKPCDSTTAAAGTGAGGSKGTRTGMDAGACVGPNGCACALHGETCTGDSDCCEGACLATSGGARACGSGEVEVTDSSCTYQGVFGLDLSEFQVTLSGTASVPPGGGVILYSDPANTMGASNGSEGPRSCGSWSAPDGPGDCSRGAGDPEMTSFTFSYNFSSTSRSGEISPSISAVDANGSSLDSAMQSVACGNAQGTADAGTAGSGGSSGSGGGSCSDTDSPTGTGTASCMSSLVCPTYSCTLSCNAGTCMCLSNGNVQRTFPQDAACETQNDLGRARNQCSCFP